MNYTENYHLPQWEETDRIMRTDFNDAMANIDQGVAQAAVLPFAVGSYESAYFEQEITVGFRPSAVIIWTNQTGSQGGYFSAYSSEQSSEGRVTMTDTGFRLAEASGNRYPLVNGNGLVYGYIAFR